MIRSSIFLLSILLTACVAPVDEAPIGKSDARAMASKADNSFDFCEAFDWYGDGVCDDFCANPDPDCDGSQYCYSDDDCGTGEACNAAEVCLSTCSPGMACPAVCAGFCVEAPPANECWGAWSDEFGNCRTPADGIYPDSCCAAEMCGGFANIPCQDDQFCSFGNPPSDAAADMSGVCLPRPQVCIKIFAPVCGTDGQTYSNSCMANSAGVDVKHEGECQPSQPADGAMCGGFANIPCASPDQWCSFGDVPSGAAADMSGVCKTMPQVCPQIFAPVCGKDGQTYSNSCMANGNGVDLAHTGACI